jgi:hypothetical protein
MKQEKKTRRMSRRKTKLKMKIARWPRGEMKPPTRDTDETSINPTSFLQTQQEQGDVNPSLYPQPSHDPSELSHDAAYS